MPAEEKRKSMTRNPKLETKARLIIGGKRVRFNYLWAARWAALIKGNLCARFSYYPRAAPPRRRA